MITIARPLQPCKTILSMRYLLPGQCGLALSLLAMRVRVIRGATLEGACPPSLQHDCARPLAISQRHVPHPVPARTLGLKPTLQKHPTSSHSPPKKGTPKCLSAVYGAIDTVDRALRWYFAIPKTLMEVVMQENPCEPPYALRTP
jgi:hypothetical protein